MISWFSLHSNRARLYRWITILGSFAVVQLLVQALNAVAGFLLVRTMEKPDYAWFTIANGMSTALSILSDSGVGIAVTSIGGTIWQDKASLNSLVRAALRMRLKLAAIASVVVSGVSLWLLLRNGAGIATALGLTALVLAPIWQISTTAVLNVVNRLHSRTRQLQVADLVPAVVRASLTASLAVFGGLGPLSALGAVVIAQLIQYGIVRKQVLPLIGRELNDRATLDYTEHIKKVILQMLPNCIFVCIQGQLTTWIISVFATSSEVADLGALNRLAIIFAILGGPLAQAVSPAFARSTNPRQLLLVAVALVFGMLVFGTSLLMFAWLKSDWFLWFLGAKYANLHQELLLVLAGIAISSLSSFVWSLNNARGWLRLAWLNIPLTISAQAVAVCLIPIDSVQGVAWFVIVTAVVQCVHSLATCLYGIIHEQRAKEDGGSYPDTYPHNSA